MFSHVSDHVLKTFVKAYKKNVSKRKFKRPRACFQDVLKKNFEACFGASESVFLSVCEQVLKAFVKVLL